MQEGRKLRILEVTTSYPRFKGDYPGIFNFRLDRELVKAGVEVEVIAPAAPGYPSAETIDGIRIRRVAYFWPKSLQTLAYGTGIKSNILGSPLRLIQAPLLFLSFLIAILRRGRDADIVHCHWAPTGFIGLIARPIIGRPVILTLGGTDYRDLPVFFWKYVVEHSDAVVAVATETERYLEKICFKDYTLIRTPVDEEEFDPAIVGEGIKDEFKTGDERIVLFTGRIYPLKGPKTLVEAAPYVLKEREGVRFFIVGEGEMLDELKATAKKLGVADKVVFTGTRTDVAGFLKAASVYAALSPVENTWSNSIAEAMFMEVPMILTDAGYTSEFFKDGQDCLLIPPDDPRRLADAILYLLDHPEKCKSLVKGAKDLLERSGKRKDIIVGQTIGLYRALAN